jgi:hypothetical protein
MLKLESDGPSIVAANDTTAGTTAMSAASPATRRRRGQLGTPGRQWPEAGGGAASTPRRESASTLSTLEDPMQERVSER